MANQVYGNPTMDTAVPVAPAAPGQHSTVVKDSQVGRPIPGGHAASLSAVGFRVGQVILSLVALIVLASANECGYSFSDFHSLRYLLAALILQLLWSLSMLIVELLFFKRGGSISGGRNFGIGRFVGDFIVLLITFSAFAAAAAICTDFFSGQCTGCESFCAQIRAATALAFFAFLLELPSFFLSTYILFTHVFR